MVERQHPEEPDVDAIFESIVARWDDEVPEGEQQEHDRDPGPIAPFPHRQSTGDVRGALRPRAPRPPAQPDLPARDDEGVPWRVDPTHSVADALLGNDDDPGDADDGEGFVPSAPAPLPPATDRLFWGALLGLGIGVLGLVWLVVTRPPVGSWTTIIVLTAIIGGFVCLVVRQPRDRDDDPTNGARV